ncbi:uncharacterized protein B0H18DRAFT_1123562 [Fomitopsis serialis]|uniref:uncharacterized protein n=1 Tax=Fomitopsis serialis TaxID=139415 RepID=UPI0020077F17|nr:uncharacterized protein B0H18DRAFT_1123562 [Neoantrodia serialis]KAH9917471.1 hypothetical protein B0H18DRAFT_1123562 [Neoantrodia serialis]
MAPKTRTSNQGRRSPEASAAPAPQRSTPPSPPSSPRTNQVNVAGVTPNPWGENGSRPGRPGSPSYAAMVVRGPVLGPTVTEPTTSAASLQPTPTDDVPLTAQPVEPTAQAATAPAHPPQELIDPQPALAETPDAPGEPPVQDRKRKKKVNKGKAREKPMIPIGSGHPPGVARIPAWETDEYQRHVSESRKRRRVTNDNLSERAPSPPARVQDSPGASFAQTASLDFDMYLEPDPEREPTTSEAYARFGIDPRLLTDEHFPPPFMTKDAQWVDPKAPRWANASIQRDVFWSPAGENTEAGPSNSHREAYGEPYQHPATRGEQVTYSAPATPQLYGDCTDTRSTPHPPRYEPPHVPFSDRTSHPPRATASRIASPTLVPRVPYIAGQTRHGPNAPSPGPSGYHRSPSQRLSHNEHPNNPVTAIRRPLPATGGFAFPIPAPPRTPASQEDGDINMHDDGDDNRPPRASTCATRMSTRTPTPATEPTLRQTPRSLPLYLLSQLRRTDQRTTTTFTTSKDPRL